MHGSHFTAWGWWGMERSCYLRKILTMLPPVEKIHRTSLGRWGLHCSLLTAFEAREQESKHWCKLSKQGSVDPWTKQWLKFGGWEGWFSSRAAQRAYVVSWAGVVVKGTFGRKSKEGGRQPSQAFRKAEQCAIFGGSWWKEKWVLDYKAWWLLTAACHKCSAESCDGYFPSRFFYLSFQKQEGNAQSLMQNKTEQFLIAPHSQVEKCDNWDSSLRHI